MIEGFFKPTRDFSAFIILTSTSTSINIAERCITSKPYRENIIFEVLPDDQCDPRCLVYISYIDISKFPKVMVILTYWEAFREISELSYES